MRGGPLGTSEKGFLTLWKRPKEGTVPLPPLGVLVSVCDVWSCHGNFSPMGARSENGRMAECKMEKSWAHHDITQQQISEPWSCPTSSVLSLFKALELGPSSHWQLRAPICHVIQGHWTSEGRTKKEQWEGCAVWRRLWHDRTIIRGRGQSQRNWSLTLSLNNFATLGEVNHYLSLRFMTWKLSG